MTEGDNMTGAQATTDEALDLSARYSVKGYGGIAFYLRGWAEEQRYEEPVLICDDEDCDHDQDSCYTEGEYVTVVSDTMVRAVMVGDDREHLVDVSDLTKLNDDDYCAHCGQIGCRWG